MKTIAAIDDHVLFSSGLALLLAEIEPKIHIDLYESVSEFFDKGPTTCDLIILDFYLPGSEFYENQSLLKKENPTVPIIVISASPSPADRLSALSAGAVAFLNKNARPSLLLETVVSVLGNKIPPNSADTAMSQLIPFNLTERQLEILIPISKGYSNKDIASMFEISPETVKSHLKLIFKRIGVSNRVEAIEFVRQHGLL